MMSIYLFAGSDTVDTLLLPSSWNSKTFSESNLSQGTSWIIPPLAPSQNAGLQ